MRSPDLSLSLSLSLSSISTTFLCNHLWNHFLTHFVPNNVCTVCPCSLCYLSSSSCSIIPLYLIIPPDLNILTVRGCCKNTCNYYCHTIICVSNVDSQGAYSVWTSVRVVECNYIRFVLGFDCKNLNCKCLTTQISTSLVGPWGAARGATDPPIIQQGGPGLPIIKLYIIVYTKRVIVLI